MHGELPDYFEPKVWWLVLGSNDLGRMQCSEEVVVLGILRIVEEILERRPNAKIVINSLFPMTAIRGGLYPVISDYQDSFGLSRDGHRLLRDPSTASAFNLWRDDDSLHRNLFFGRKRKDEPVAQVLPPHQMTEDEMAELAEKIEQARDAQSKREQPYSWLHPVSNPIMEDKEKMRKYELGKHILHKAAQPLWTSIKAINKELRKFADKHDDRVTFFDSTGLFTAKEGKKYTLLTDLITVRGHPTALGFEKWENAIVEKLHNVLNIMKEEQPDLFESPKNKTQNDFDVVDIIEDSLPEDDDMDEAILHPNDDGFKVAPTEDVESLESDDDDDDESGEEESKDDGELFVPAPNYQPVIDGNGRSLWWNE